MKPFILRSITALIIAAPMTGLGQSDTAANPTPANTGGSREQGFEKRFDQRQANQQKRIQEGEKNGALTGQESRHLEREQGRIQKAEDRAKADGVVTKKEAKGLEKMQNHASRDIYRKKHNERKRK